MMSRPRHDTASLVIIGGGIVGASAAYHLAQRGWTDVVLVDQGSLPAAGGSTSHAPGGVFMTNASRAMTLLARETVDLLGSLSADGQPCFHPVGTVEVARTPARWLDLHRKLGYAESWGVTAELLSPAGTRELVPVIDASRVLGSLHVTGDGVARPLRAVAALLASAQANGVVVRPGSRVVGFEVVRGELRAVELEGGGRIETPRVLVCAGIWGPVLGDLLGVPVPLTPCEHQYAISGRLPSLVGETVDVRHPMMRDQDRAMYYRQHGDRYGVGSYQHAPMLVPPDQIRRHGTPGSRLELNPHGEAADMPANTRWLPELFVAAWRDAGDLMPEIREAGAQYTLQGMFSFTPDGFPLVGESSRVRGAWIAEAVWVTHAGGVGRLVADWMTHGDPGIDVHELDLERFEPVQQTRAFVRARGARNYDEVYDIVHPLQPAGSARSLRTSPFQARLEDLGAVFFEGKGWERAQWFETNEPATDVARDGWAGQFWSPRIATEHRATRQRVGLFDLTSLTRAVVRGPDAETFLQWLVTGDVAVEPGTVVYTAMCTPAGGLLADATVTRLEVDRYQLGLNGAADIAHVRRSVTPGRRVVVDEVTTGTCAIGLWGPRARDVLGPLAADDDLSNVAFPYLRARTIEVGGVPVLAQRISYVGELGWELYAEAACGLRLWDELWKAGAAEGMVAAGRGAMDSLRLEKAYRSYGLDMGIEDDPYEAGIGSVVRLDKGDFAGRDALSERRAAGRARGLAMLAFDDPSAVVLGREPVRYEGRVVGFVRSAAYGYTVGRQLATVMLPAGLLAPGTPVEVRWFDRPMTAKVTAQPPVDPDGSRLRA
ncbi:MAG: hypothetical protein A2V85_06410 [Chloroflexi bacterium RBG_16_72_14]|nr:MAG: hypothetical protein A2V85_06410 [Chloroflexi bacterium RBG_16_72_14]